MMLRLPRSTHNFLSRDGLEAVSLSLVFHLICAFFILVGHPSLLRHRAQSDLFFRFEERPPLFAPGVPSLFDPPAQPAPRSGGVKVFWENWESPDEKGWLDSFALDSQGVEPSWETGGNAGVDPRDVTAVSKDDKRLLDWSQRLFDDLNEMKAPAEIELPEPRAIEGVMNYSAGKKEPSSPSPKPAAAEVRRSIPPVDLSNVGALAERKALGLALDGFTPVGTHWERSQAMPAASQEDLASSENLSIETKLYRRTTGPGLLLEATYRPKIDAQFKCLSQNVLFLIDRSSSLGGRRFDLFKSAVISALDQLQSNDTFNIVFFDKKQARFSPTCLAATEQNIAAAKVFVTDEKAGGYFNSSDLYTSLEQIALPEAAKDAVTSALLLTNGETRLSRERQRRSIASFCAKNDGKVALFIAAEGRKNNLPPLELLAHFNKGRLCHAPDEEHFFEQMTTLINSLRSPMGTEMLASAISSHSIPPQLLPLSGQQSDLYPTSVHKVVGLCPNPGDFYLYLQGRHGDDWLDIKCKVRDDHRIEEPDPEVEKRHLVLQAFEHYGNYLKSGDLKELKKAQELLHTLGYPIAFSQR